MTKYDKDINILLYIVLECHRLGWRFAGKLFAPRRTLSWACRRTESSSAKKTQIHRLE